MATDDAPALLVALIPTAVMSLPRVGLLRAIMLNHWYHHRGQMQVYLRLLDVPVPNVHGPTADEMPFL